MTGKDGLSEAEVSLLEGKAHMIRHGVIELSETAKNGHYGSGFSMAELLAVLYYRVLRVRPEQPDWYDRDRFVLSKGHAVLALYPVLADLGYFPAEILRGYAQLDGAVGDHPRVGSVPGIDCTTGSLGHGLSLSVGMALGLRASGSPGRVYCLLGDGELAEGQVWEAAMSAAHHRLGNLVAIVDANGVGSGSTIAAAMENEPLTAKWSSFGWKVVELSDGHDVVAVHTALTSHDSEAEVPTVVIARTVAGKGVSFMEGTWQWHLGYLGEADRALAVAELKAAGPDRTARRRG